MLLTLGSQRILDEFEGLNKEIRTTKKRGGKPIVDASDVAKLLLALPFVLDGLGQQELEAYNSRQVRASDRLSDPFRPIIGALNEYLHAYHVYWAEALSVTEIVKLDTKSRQALDTLQLVFPYSVCHAGGRQSALRVVQRRRTL